MKKYLMMIFISLLFASAVYAGHPEYNAKQICTDCHTDCSIENITMTGKISEKCLLAGWHLLKHSGRKSLCR